MIIYGSIVNAQTLESPHNLEPGGAGDTGAERLRVYRGHILPAAIDGEDYGQDRANTPWGYNQETGDTLSRGDWFLDPAKALTYHARFEGEFSRKYVYNPYLADLGLIGE